MEYNSGSGQASNFKIGQAQTARPILNYEHDYSLFYHQCRSVMCYATIYSVIVGELRSPSQNGIGDRTGSNRARNLKSAAFWCFRSVCGEDLDKIFND